MALIKTDSQNYTDIADAIRDVTGGGILFDEDVTTTSGENSKYIDWFIDDYSKKIGETFEVIYDNNIYQCELKLLSGSSDYIYLGNTDLVSDEYDGVKEPFLIMHYKHMEGSESDLITSTLVTTSEPGTHHFKITKKYKPEEMAPALDGVFPDYGVSYDTLSGNGENPVTGSTYGYKAVGFAENNALSSVNISDKTREIGDYAFHYCNQLSISTLPEGVEIIGRSAFYRCNAITSFTFPKSIKKIGGSAFDYCTSLKTVTFKGTPDEIVSTAFAMNSGITFNVPWSEGEVAGYPWGASNSTINYNYTG